MDLNMDEIQDFKEKKQAEIARHKWIASEKAGMDLGERAVREWVTEHEPDFRKYWLDHRFSFS